MVTTYIIGGPPRTGKTKLLNYLLQNHKISGISTDLLREAFLKEIPEFGLKPNQSDEERSHILWPYFKGIIKARSYFKDKLAIEGTNFLPNLLVEVKERPYLKICFLGCPNIAVSEKFQSIRVNEEEGNNWTRDLSNKELIDVVKDIKRISKKFQSDCKNFGFKFFDTSENYEATIEEAAKYLISD